MPQIPIHRKAKRATVLTKRTQYLKKYHKERSSYRPCEFMFIISCFFSFSFFLDFTSHIVTSVISLFLFAVYEKLKSNNSYLAKALSQEKQNCQSLFSQNLALIAEVQELRLACTSRDVNINVILTS